MTGSTRGRKPRNESLSAIRDQIAELEAKARELEEKEALRVGRLAIKAGLVEVAPSDTALLNAFAEMAARFRPAAGHATEPAAAPNADPASVAPRASAPHSAE